MFQATSVHLTLSGLEYVSDVNFREGGREGGDIQANLRIRFWIYFLHNSELDQDFCTICPGSSDTFYKVIYYMKWVITSWTHGTKLTADPYEEENNV